MPTSIKTWFTSDLHFGHTGVLYFHPLRREAAGITLEELQADRDAAVKKHDEWLVDLWNQTVRKEDHVYILGDFCLANKEYAEKILRRLKGKKFLIEGNHDKSLHGLERYFEWYGQIKEAKFTHNQYEFINPNETFCVEMCHYPLLTWNRRPHGTCMAHGHTHGTIDEYNTISGELRVDVGLDSLLADHKLVPLEDLYNHLRAKLDIAGVNTFEEYNEWKMKNDGFRM